ncbi:DUF6817 domain-containing protein [Streptomyces sp. NPDC046939]|uniref:DUF6817 domain-containing protein n=1 Tax=Streptomyces sp. NPDC046939 TaxID=3155376 RepID=UPI0033F88746
MTDGREELTSAAPASTADTDRALLLLRQRGAEGVAHPGGTLYDHLQRVASRLAEWRARPALHLAGLCHAFYGTDGFPTALGPVECRGDLTSVIGPEAEALVYLYASCDRAASYPTLHRSDAALRDRFTGRSYLPGLQERRDFTELTAANELDLAAINPGFRDSHGSELLALFSRVRTWLSPDAWQTCRTVLSPSGRSL